MHSTVLEDPHERHSGILILIFNKYCTTLDISEDWKESSMLIFKSDKWKSIGVFSLFCLIPNNVIRTALHVLIIKKQDQVIK